MRYKLICCEVFTRLACKAIAESPHIITPVFLKMNAHVEPDKLRAQLSALLEDSDEYDAVLLGYGLCGNATLGLSCSVPLVIPRVHDCCTVFLGSSDAYIKYFSADPSTRWGSCGYCEHSDQNGYNGVPYQATQEYQKLVEDFGQEDADYVWETMHPPVETKTMAYITLPDCEYSNTKQEFADYAKESGKELRVIEGNGRMIDDLLNGRWDDGTFCVLKPGDSIRPLYDLRRVFAN